jgi:hypothetical protein
MKTALLLRSVLTSSVSIPAARREPVDPMPSVPSVARRCSVLVRKDLLECLHHSKAVSEFLTDVQRDSVRLTMFAMETYAITSVQSILTVPEVRSVWIECVSKCAGPTRIVSRVKSVLTAPASQDVTKKKTVDLVRCANQEAVNAMKASCSPTMVVRTSMSVKTRSATHLPSAPTFQDPFSASAQQA